MSVNGVPFLIFLLLAVLLYYLFPKNLRWIILLCASVVFYLSYGLSAGLYLAVTILLTYAFSLWLGRLSAIQPTGGTPQARKAQKKQLTHKKRLVLAAALSLNFLALGVLKYGAFFVSNFNRVIQTFGRAAIPLPAFLLPLGISFYIFQTSGYLIDLYRGKYQPQRNIIRYSLFVCYFPQMVQGPINRYDTLAPVLYEGNAFHWANIQHGLLRMMFGILKKSLIADALAPTVQECYTNFYAYPGFLAFLGAALYCIQLYCDFSGGIDLLCGASTLFGVPMQENFRQPYLSTSLADFWRRWHISLGEWMKDYLFYPLALSKAFGRLAKHARKLFPADVAKRISPCLATVVVFLCVGIWQGPGWANIAYGLWNGLWMSLGLLWAPVSSKLFHRFSWKWDGLFWIVWGVIRTDFLVIIGRYFSNSGSLMSALHMLKHTVTAPGFGNLNAQVFASVGLTWATVLPVCAALVVLLAVSLAKERGVQVSQWICQRKWYVQFLILFVGLLLTVLCVYGNSEYVPIAYVYENV